MKSSVRTMNVSVEVQFEVAECGFCGRETDGPEPLDNERLIERRASRLRPNMAGWAVLWLNDHEINASPESTNVCPSCYAKLAQLAAVHIPKKGE